MLYAICDVQLFTTKDGALSASCMYMNQVLRSQDLEDAIVDHDRVSARYDRGDPWGCDSLR